MSTEISTNMNVGREKSCIIVVVCKLYAILYQIYEGKILNEEAHE